jgi:hypothetical protein
MSESSLLSADQAESVVEERIEQFGLAALPRVRVTDLEDGMWHVRWDSLERTVAPMSRDEWYAWLTENVGSLDAGDLVTTEA